MKKLFCFLMLLCAGVALHAENEVLFVYTQWGTDAFLKSEIDSITYSHFDEDNIYHSEWYAQIVHTPDSAYYYPLALMNNMEFKSTERVLQSDVIEMSDDLLSYVIAYTDSTLTLQPSTPNKLIPTVGEVLYYEGNEQPLVEGFAGRMKGLDTYSDSVVCLFDSVGIHDVFKKLLAVGRIESTSDGGAMRAHGIDKWINLPALLEKDFEPKGNFEGKAILSFSLKQPRVLFNYIINTETDDSDDEESNTIDYAKIEMHFSSDGSLKADLGITGNASMEMTLLDTGDKPLGVFAGSFEIAVLAELTGEITGLATVPFSFALTRSYEYNNFDGWSEINAKREKDYFRFGNPELKLTGYNGSLFAGIKAELKAGLISTKLDHFSIEGRAGFQYEANYPNLKNIEESRRYDVLKDCEYSRGFILSAESSFKIFDKFKIAEGPSWKRPFNTKTSPVLPSINKLNWAPTDIGKGLLTSDVSGNLWYPITVGWVLDDKEGNRSMEKFFEAPYSTNVNKTVQKTGMQLLDLPMGYYYKAYPAAQFMGVTVPYTSDYVEVKPTMVILSDFTITESRFKKDGFENEGVKYDYKYNTSLKLTLDSNVDASALQDWGYAYYDLNGDTTLISLKDKPTPYVDTRYAYYRNEMFSTLKLCGYVQFKDRGNIEFDNWHTFDLYNPNYFCPDANHPHMIDLGLPSGTKWACCDVGAATPGDQGSLFAWGETKPKDEYLPANYRFYRGTDVDGDGQYARYWIADKTYLWIVEITSGDYKLWGHHICFDTYEKCIEWLNRTTIDIYDYYIVKSHSHYLLEPWSVNVPKYDISGTSLDAAYVNWGHRWRMPNRERAAELNKYCKSQYCTDADGNTYLQIYGPNGKFILMPMDGHWISKAVPNYAALPDEWYRSREICELYEDYDCEAHAYGYTLEDCYGDSGSEDEEYDSEDDYYDSEDEPSGGAEVSVGLLIRAIGRGE